MQGIPCWSLVINISYSRHENELSSRQDKSKPLVTDTISEHKVILELLWSLASPSASPLFFATADSGCITYSVRPNITVPSLTKVKQISLTCNFSTHIFARQYFYIFQDVFHDIMTEMCSYFGMIKSLRDFSRDVLSCELSQLPSTSYNGYASAIRKAMQPLLDQIIELEKQAHKQGKLITFLNVLITCNIYHNPFKFCAEISLSLIKAVQILRPRLKEVEVIYDLHKRAVLPWNSNPNWVCATQ